MEMATKIFALGNSNAVRLPKIVMEALALKAEDPIIIEIVNNKEIVLRKKETSEQYTSIKALLCGYSGSYKPSEMDSAESIGRELI